MNAAGMNSSGAGQTGGGTDRLTDTLYALTNSYRTLMEPRVGVTAPGSYEVGGLVKAVNAIGERIAAQVAVGSLDSADQIPF